MKPQFFSTYALRLMILILGLQQLSTQAAAKEDIDCTTLAQSDARVEDESGLTASEETNANPLRILVQGRPVLYWKKEDQQPENMRFCAKVALKAPSTNPVLLGGSVYKPKASGALVLPIEWKEETTTLLLTQIDEEGELHPTKIVLKGLSPQQLVERLFPKVTLSNRKKLGI